MAGYDTAGTVQGVWGSAVKNKFGSPAFWIRYFSPSNYTPVNSSSANANAECSAVWTSGAEHLGCVSTPASLDGTSADGSAQAGTFGSAMHQVWLWVGPLDLPTNGTLYTWLDQEPGYNLSYQFWDGWAERLDNWNFNDDGIYPFYAAFYCDPCNTTKNCSALRSASYVAFGIWTPDPQAKCGYTCQNTPAWAAKTCAGCGGGGSAPTSIWQFYIQNTCSSLDVDVDVGAPGFNTANYCFSLSSNP